MIDWNLTWTMVIAVSTGAIALAACGGLVFALKQVSDFKRQRRLEVARDLHRTFVDLMDERDFVAEELPEVLKQCKDPWEDLKPDQRRKVFRILSLFERAGAYVDHKIVDQDFLFDLISVSIPKCWETAKPCIDSLRQMQKDDKLYENFEALVKEYRAWRQQHPPKKATP